MLHKVTTQETHIRTVVKSALYRVLSVVTAVILALLLGGNIQQALTLGFVALAIGAVHYYLYDRLWLYIPWQRSDDGHDTYKRSIVKAIIYRITAWIILMIIAWSVFADTTFTAFLFATLKFAANACTYFILDRIFNWINWGKYKLETETETV
jgi:uncharacterized membrane protein